MRKRRQILVPVYTMTKGDERFRLMMHAHDRGDLLERDRLMTKCPWVRGQIIDPVFLQQLEGTHELAREFLVLIAGHTARLRLLTALDEVIACTGVVLAKEQPAKCPGREWRELQEEVTRDVLRQLMAHEVLAVKALQAAFARACEEGPAVPDHAVLEMYAPFALDLLAPYQEALEEAPVDEELVEVVYPQLWAAWRTACDGVPTPRKAG
jgi:hypothetical protein